jgi:hypothetical protein
MEGVGSSIDARRRSVKKISVLVLGFLVLAGVLGAVVTHFGTRGPTDTASQGRGATLSVSSLSPMAAASPMPAPVLGAQAVTNTSEKSSGSQGLAAPTAPTAPTAGSASSGSSSAYSTVPLSSVGNVPTVGPKIVKTADISVIVAKDGFDSAWTRASMVADKYGGYVVSSSTAGVKSKSASMVIRIPASRFDQARTDLAGLGTVDSQSINGTDVTSQFIDLQARLKTWQAQEAVLMRLMARANTIAETMTVQNSLQEVQYRIEQIQGQLRELHNQTAFATIQFSMRDQGVPVGPKPVAQKPSLVAALDRAVSGFLGVVSAVVVGLGYLIPLAVIALLGWVVVRRLRRGQSVPVEV